MVVEPLVQCAAGMLAHPKGFLSGLRRLCDKYDVLLIVDEVAVGFGRTGRMFACEHENVVPDFLCLAKGITGGYMPLAATLATDGIWKAFLGTYAESKTFFHGHTYGGNPLGAAVALANLRIFDEERTLEQIEPKIRAIVGAPCENLKALPCRRRASAWADCRNRTGTQQIDERTVSLGRTPRLARLSIGLGRRRVCAATGKCCGHYAAVGNSTR